MVSTILELAGFAAIVIACFFAGGLIGGLFALGVVLLVCGYAAGDLRLIVSLPRGRRRGR